MNILYIAYSCSPVHGSEDAIGWNIPAESARENGVYVITKEEQRPYIEAYIRENPIENIQFFYGDIPVWCKHLFRGPFYSGRLNIWHKYAQKLAQLICAENKIDVIHQITPIEFRSIGHYGRIPGVKFVCGPIAGGQKIEPCLLDYTGPHKPMEQIRSIINRFFRVKLSIARTLKDCDCVLYANNETKEFLSGLDLPDLGQQVQSEVGIRESQLRSKEHPNQDRVGCCFLVAGRLVYLKGHRYLFDALKQVDPNLEYQCRIVGDGPERQALEESCHALGLSNRVHFTGGIPYSEMEKEYENADVLVFPSLREATGTVILEAMARGIPVVTMNKFGGATILDDDCGWLCAGTDKASYIESLKRAMTACIQNPAEVVRRGENARMKARQYTWELKNQYYRSLYSKLCAGKWSTANKW